MCNFKRFQLPTFLLTEGLKIEYFSGEHPPPHVHVTYAEYEVLLTIEGQTVYEGSLPSRKLKRAKELVEENKDDLLYLFNDLNKHLLRKT